MLLNVKRVRRVIPALALVLSSLAGSRVAAAQVAPSPFDMYGCIDLDSPGWPNAYCLRTTWQWLPIAGGLFYGWRISYPDPTPPNFVGWRFDRTLDIHVYAVDGRVIDSFDESLIPGPIDFEVARIEGWYSVTDASQSVTAYAPFNFHPVPEPASIALVAAGMAGLALVARRRRR